MTHVDHRDLLARAAGTLDVAMTLVAPAHEAAWSGLRGVGDGVRVSGSHLAPPWDEPWFYDDREGHEGEKVLRSPIALPSTDMPEPVDRTAAESWRLACTATNDLHAAVARVAADHGVPHGRVVFRGAARGVADLCGALRQARWTLGVLLRQVDLRLPDDDFRIGDHAKAVMEHLREATGPARRRLCIQCRQRMPDELTWPHPRCAKHMCCVCHQADRPPKRRECDACRTWKHRHGGSTDGRRCDCTEAAAA